MHLHVALLYRSAVGNWVLVPYTDSIPRGARTHEVSDTNEKENKSITSPRATVSLSTSTWTVDGFHRRILAAPTPGCICQLLSSRATTGCVDLGVYPHPGVL